MPLYKSRLVRQTRSLVRSVRSLLAVVNQTPVIIFGKEKSGTTAIAALLAKHTGQSVTLDIQALWGAAEVRIRTGELAFPRFVQRNRGAFARAIIKEPCLTFLYPQVRAMFPGARRVMVVRDPRDNIRSVFNRLRLSGRPAMLEPGVLERLSPGWRVVLDPELQGLQPASYIEVAARRWNNAADVYLEHREEMILIRYEDFNRRKVETIWRLADALELPHANDISDRIDVQYQRAGDRSISRADFFGPRNLALIEEICGSRMRELGYERGPDQGSVRRDAETRKTSGDTTAYPGVRSGNEP